ncbi:Glyoxalase/Bleomycin resistance protein/Dihydroxybiphenyl dioxygenase [Phlyctochytrium arcticum]|nr:Glyoxalase/Bleomycin resistance protein/Dihydroxybiphenyl dioxygenase [Phlyctochytrium arcticum]
MALNKPLLQNGDIDFGGLDLHSGTANLKSFLHELGARTLPERCDGLETECIFGLNDGAFIRLLSSTPIAGVWIPRVFFRSRCSIESAFPKSQHSIFDDGKASFIYVRYVPDWTEQRLEIFVMDSSSDGYLYDARLSTFRAAGRDTGTNKQHRNSLIDRVDHLAFAVPNGQLDNVTLWFQQQLGFVRFVMDGESQRGVEVRQAGNGMRMITLQHGTFFLVVCEPLDDLVGQVTDFVNLHRVGVQHIAFSPSDIIQVVSSAKASKYLEFAQPSKAAWEEPLLIASKETSVEIMDKVVSRKELGILTQVRGSSSSYESRKDGKTGGILSQIFTKPFASDCCIFFELIERFNFDGFAPKSIAALFDSMQVDFSILVADSVAGSGRRSRDDDAVTNLTMELEKWVAKIKNVAGLNVSCRTGNFNSPAQLDIFLRHSAERYHVVFLHNLSATDELARAAGEQLQLIHSIPPAPSSATMKAGQFTGIPAFVSSGIQKAITPYLRAKFEKMSGTA